MANNRVDIDLFIDSKTAANSLGELKRSIKELKNEALQFEQGTAEFNKLTAAAGQLNDRVADINGTVKVLSGNVQEQLTSSFAGVARAGIGAFTALQGAQAIFGDENKDLQKTLVKLQGALALSQGIKEFANLGQAAKDFKTVIGSLTTSTLAQVSATRAAAAAQGQSTIAYLASSAAAGALAVANGVVSASTAVVTGLMTTFGITATAAWAAATLGVSALITGIIALIAYYDEIIASVKEFFGLQSEEAAEAEKSAAAKIAADEKYKEKRLDNQAQLNKAQIRAEVLSGKITEEEGKKKILKEDFILAYKKKTLEAGLALQKAASKEEQEAIKANLAEDLKILTKNFENDLKESNNADKKKNDDKIKANKEANEKIAQQEKDAQKKAQEQLLKLQLDAFKNQLDEEEKILSDSNDKIIEIEKAFVESGFKVGSEQEKQKNDAINLIKEEATKKIEEKKSQIEKDEEAKRQEEQKKSLSERLKTQKEVNDEILRSRQEEVNSFQLQIDKGLAQGSLSAEQRIQLETDKFDKLIEIAETAGEDTARLEFEKEQVILQIQEEEGQKRIQRAQEIANGLLNIVSQFSQLSLSTQETDLKIEEEREKRKFDNRRKSIEENIKDETKRKNALDKLNKEQAASEERLAKKRLDLERKKIKSDRNLAIAQVAIGSAVLIANAVASTSKTDPVTFALSLAANLAVAAGAIIKAKNALKEVDAKAAEFGEGGGGSDIQVPDANVAGGGEGAGGFVPPPRFNFQGEQIGGGGNFIGGAGGGGISPIRVYVTESDISNVQNQVNVIQGNSLFGSGGG